MLPVSLPWSGEYGEAFSTGFSEEETEGEGAEKEKAEPSLNKQASHTISPPSQHSLISHLMKKLCFGSRSRVIDAERLRVRWSSVLRHTNIYARASGSFCMECVSEHNRRKVM